MVKHEPLKPTSRNYLIQARRNLGLTQDEAAALTGISRDMLFRYESGEGGSHGPSAGRIIALCAAYKALALATNTAEGYTAAEYNLTALCPGEFDLLKPACK